ncbi:ShlB/FhaC/HecB family hemolysin secretion/activation protein [Microbulbifer sp. SA54]|uniref:ShlB/FhaC/HecB family hemolysin secretion/activation protein n=1 Tax=Microbulbifer sp. SA54 TaxID=3401577 RepID=UPI003AAD0B38
MDSKYKGLLSISILGLVIAGNAAQAQEDTSSFRSRVRAAFEQDLPTVDDDALNGEFERRTREARDPNLDADIPEVTGRELGPRISVKKIQFHRLEEYPEYGIGREQVEALAESLRAKYMQEDKELAAGYTVENLKELALLLDGMGARYSADKLGPQQLRKLVNVIERQNAQRGLTYADLEDIAAQLTRFYRKQGLFLAQVQIPAQEVKDGVVTFTIQEGILGQVAVHDNQVYSAEQLASAFDDQKGKLVNRADIEESLYLLNDLPSSNVTGYFSPGDNPGETRLNLKVRDESSWQVVSRLDNHGSTFTGDSRIYTAVDWFNPAGIGDSLTVGILRSAGSGDWSSDFGSTLGQFKYSLPVLGPRTRFQVSADYNEFDIRDVEDPDNYINLLEISGVNESYAMTLDHKFRRSREFNVTGSISATEKITELSANYELNGDHVVGGELGLYFDKLSSGAIPMLNMVNVKLQYGDLKSLTDEQRQGGRDEEFEKFAADTNSLLFLPMPFSNDKSRLILKSRWQYSDQPLPAFEQFSLGGANGVRAFDVRDFSSDQAALVSAEWYPAFSGHLNPKVFDRRLSELFQFAVIADAAYGVVNYYDGESPDDWGAISGAGVLLRFSWKDSWSAQVSAAWPTMSKFSDQKFDDDFDDPTFYADFSYFLH